MCVKSSVVLVGEIEINGLLSLYNFNTRRYAESRNEIVSPLFLNENSMNNGFNYFFDAEQEFVSERISKFEPILLNEQKSLYIVIREDGALVPAQIINDNIQVFDLSESDRAIFNFLCWVEIIKLKQEIAKLQNSEEKFPPLFILNFVERLDETVDIKMLLQKVTSIGRRVFIFVKDEKDANRVR